MSPGMLCVSNDTIFASRGPVCSEKTPADENHRLSKLYLIWIYTIFSNINIQISPGVALWFQ